MLAVGREKVKRRKRREEGEVGGGGGSWERNEIKTVGAHRGARTVLVNEELASPFDLTQVTPQTRPIRLGSLAPFRRTLFLALRDSKQHQREKRTRHFSFRSVAELDLQETLFWLRELLFKVLRLSLVVVQRACEL